MTVNVEYLQPHRLETVQNGGNSQQVEVTVLLQDLPVGTYHNVQKYLQLLPGGKYAVTGYLIPHNGYFNIEPGQNLSIGTPYELIRVEHDDMRRFKPQGLPVLARRHVAPNQPPTQYEDAIIHPL